jgi:hypothetical protein
MKDKFYLWLAKRLPRQLLYWSVIVVWSEATQKHPTKECPSFTVDEILTDWCD